VRLWHPPLTHLRETLTMPKLRFHGKTLQRYNGIDHGKNNLMFSVNPGEHVEVSEEKAKQLLVDYPQDFEHASTRKDEAEEASQPVKREPKETPPVESGKVPKKNKMGVPKKNKGK
jgi:hypothetical protein